MDSIHVLVVEDEPTLARIIKDALEANSIRVTLAYDGESGLQAFADIGPDIVVADIMMPRLSGLDMVRSIRQTDTRTPILFLTAKSTVDDVVEGFHAGGNDYLKKPFSMKELMVRIQALLGRLTPAPVPQQAEWLIGDYRFVPGKRTLTYLPTGESHELPHRESEILARLCASPHALVPAKDILLDLWGDDDFFCTRSFQTLISRLRRRLAKDSHVKLINQRGEGYRLLF